MRDPARIDDFCDRLATQWKKAPDWRFGQLLSNILGDDLGHYYYIEDNEIIDDIEGYFVGKKS